MSNEGHQLLELAIHVKLASEAMIAAARDLVTLRPPDETDPAAAAWLRTMEGLTAMNVQIGLMERALRNALRQAPPRRTARATLRPPAAV